MALIFLKNLKFENFEIFCTKCLTFVKNNDILLSRKGKMNHKVEQYTEKISSNVFFIKTLDRLGIKKKYTGYYYLVDILDLVINKGMKTNKFSKKIYPLVADKYHKTECTIERNIRSVISRCCDEKFLDKVDDVYSCEKAPTCCKFIRIIKDFIMAQIS